MEVLNIDTHCNCHFWNWNRSFQKERFATLKTFLNLKFVLLSYKNLFAYELLSFQMKLL